jgi:hypothetical protein
MRNMTFFVRGNTAVAVILFLFLPLRTQAQVKPIVEPYKVEKDLSNVVNSDDFEKAMEHYTGEFSFSEAQKERLVQNGFVVAPADAEQFFHIYEGNHFGVTPRIPNFITSDCVLQLYHLFYDFNLRYVEVKELLPPLRKLTQAMLEGSKKQLEEISDSTLKAACLKNISFFGVAAKLLGIEEKPLPKNCISEIDDEIRKIEQHAGRQHSTIFPFYHDYSQYIVRGHYTRSEELKRFFLVMMWYGLNSFPFEFEGKRTKQQILQALLITDLLTHSRIENEPILRLWDKIYSITVLYVGSTDDLNVYQFQKLMNEVYGEYTTLEVFSDYEKLDLFYKKSAELPQPRIVPQLEGMPSGLQFRFMGQRFIPDSYIMQKLVSWPERPWPMGLDVMAVLGSKRSANLLDEFYKEPEKWKGYLPQREKLIEEFKTVDEKEWYQNLFYGWLYALKALLEEKGEGYPSFMQNSAWTDKELNTALASWAELRHDVILYAKASGAEGEGGHEEVIQPKGYVEPAFEFYKRLLKLAEQNEQILSDKSYLSEKVGKAFDQFQNLLSFLKDVSQKELLNHPLTHEEYERIRYFGSEIEDLSLSLADLVRDLPTYDWQTGEEIKGEDVKLKGWFDVTGADKDIACIADVHTSGGACLEEAVGHISLVYVIVPIEDKLHLTRGGVFSYYEFHYPIAHRLTDEAWQEMIKRGQAPEPPGWISSFMAK